MSRFEARAAAVGVLLLVLFFVVLLTATHALTGCAPVKEYTPPVLIPPEFPTRYWSAENESNPSA